MCILTITVQFKARNNVLITMHLDILIGVPVDVHHADQCADQRASQDQDVYVIHHDLRTDLHMESQSDLYVEHQ